MSKYKPVLVDESPFVYITRNNNEFEHKSQLALFIEKCRKKNTEREYIAFSTYSTKYRLGFGFIYNTFRIIFTRNQIKKSRFEKRLERRVIARKVIAKFKKPKFLRIRPRKWSLMDLHLFANENKRESLDRPLKPEEVIPLEVCYTALIAHENNIPIFSFNKDYEYFIQMAGIKGQFIQYWKPHDILRNLAH